MGPTLSAVLQAQLLPALLSALWCMAALQYDPGQELMQMGAQLLATEAGNMDTQAGLPACRPVQAAVIAIQLPLGLLSACSQLMLAGAAGG